MKRPQSDVPGTGKTPSPNKRVRPTDVKVGDHLWTNEGHLPVISLANGDIEVRSRSGGTYLYARNQLSWVLIRR